MAKKSSLSASFPDGAYANYEDGLIKDEGAYLNGKEQGEWRRYRIVKGKSVLVGLNQYTHGLADGLQETFRDDGTPWYRTPFVKGMTQGIRTIYNYNGKVSQVTPFDKGKQNGVEKQYDSQGNLTRTTEWVHGKVIRSTGTE